MVNVEQENIRALDTDKAVKGFALTEYIFKSAVTVTTTDGDNVRWYQETAADLVAPANIAGTSTAMRVRNKAMLAVPINLEVSWTRNTSYIQEYMAESTISEMDVMSTDIDALARTLLRLTRSVVRQVDFDILNTANQSFVYTPNVFTSINSYSAFAAWSMTTAVATNDILSAMRLIEENDYGPEGVELWLSPYHKQRLLNYLIDTKGASIPQFSSEKVQSGVLFELLGLKVRVSNNIDKIASYALVLNPKKAVTWKQHTDTTSRIIEEPGLHRKVRVWERGVGLLTDPKAITVILNI